MNDVDVLVVGGGISGLTTAWGLAQRGVEVAVWEGAERPGGKIRSRRQDGYLTERAASMVLNFRPEVSRFIGAAGLNDAKVARSDYADGHRYVVDGGRLTAVPTTPLGLLRSPLWSWRGKLRLLSEPLRPRGGDVNESVSAFVTRRLGREFLDKALEPFVSGTLASDPDLANARATLPRMTGLERSYGSLTAGVVMHRLRRRRTACVSEVFSFNGGMEALVGQLARAPGVALATGVTVVGLARDGKGWRITADGGDGPVECRARRVVISTPAGAAANLVDPLDAELTTALNGIRYAPLAVVHCGYDRDAVGHPLDGTGFLAPRTEGVAVNGNLWPSSLFPYRAPAGRVLLSSYVGGSRCPEALDLDDARLVETAHRALHPLLALQQEPVWWRVDRHRRALPLYYGAYPQRLDLIGDRLRHLPGLELVANYRGGVSVRDRIVAGMEAAERLAGQLGATARCGRPWPEAALPLPVR